MNGGRHFAILIGASEFPEEPSLSALRCPQRDVEGLAAALTAQETGLFADPLIFINEPHHKVLRAINRVFKQASRQDQILIYYSGHGKQDSAGSLHLATADTDVDALETTSIAVDSFRKLIDNYACKQVALILDCCFGGAAGKDFLKGGVDDQLQQVGRGIYVLTASTATQTAREKDGDEYSLLTKHILHGITHGEADQDDDGLVSMDDLYEYVRARVPREAPQHPMKWALGIQGGEFAIARVVKIYSPEQGHAAWEDHQHTQIRERELRLRAMLTDHSGFVRDRLASFVGRARELDEIRQRIAEKLPHGGYVTITGQAGQGKSSVIAKLVEESGFDNAAYHFIPFNPGPDHQISLLRNLMARLILKYKLSDIYLASESRPALRDFLPNVLAEVAARGGKDVIFIDGLDQLLEDSNGERDLSFLPTSLPAGIVCVLGTRPNDTLNPLELLKPHQEYQLPDLSRSDFDLILIRRGVALGRELADRFYSAMQANALYLDLVAKELAEAEEIDPGSLIQRLADNPDNIFSLTVDRLKRQHWQWREVIKPTLGLLLAARTPLGQLAIRQLLGVDGQTLRDGLQKLGGLLAQDVKGRYHLFHLKLRDFLRQDERRPNKTYIFDTDEEEIWHSRLAAWCEAGEGGLDVIWQDDKHNAAEQERRIYAREHYITHLYLAKRWEKLWSVLDAGLYGKAKIQYDPSTRSYTNDLRLGCQASTLETLSTAEKTVQLPRLWRYVLLHCSLIGKAKLYPEELFTLLVLKHRDREAIELVEFLPNPETKVVALCRTAQALGYTGRGQEALTTLRRAASIARDVHDKWEHVKVFRMLARTLAELGEWDEAVDVAYELGDSIGRVNALAMVAEELAVAGEKERFEQLVEKIKHLAGLIGYNWEQEATSHTMMRILGGSENWNQIINETWLSGKSKLSEKNIVMLSKALVGAGHQRVARSMVYIVDGTSYKSEILVSVAKQLAKSDDRASVSHLLEEMVEYARATKGPEKIDTLISAALYNSAIGRREAAARLLADSLPAMQVVDDSNERIHTFVAFAEEIADLGGLDSARPVLVEAQGLGIKIRDEQDRSMGLKVIADAYARLGDDVAATDLYTQSGWAPLALLDSDNIEQIANELVAQGYVQQAVDLLMTDKHLEQLVQQKKWNEAIESARKATNPERQAARTAVVARSALRMGERGLALKFLKEAIDIAAHISKRNSRVQVYLSIIAVAAESGSVDDVVKLSDEVIASISLFQETKEKVDVLYLIAMSLAGVGLKDLGFTIVNDMMRIVANVGDYTVRSYAFRKLSKAMTRYEDLERLIALIQQHFLRVTIRDEALKLLPTVSGLISRDPETIYNFTQSFTWVDDFLKVT